MFVQYASQIFMLVFLNVLVTGTIEFFKVLIISFPDKWGAIFALGFPAEIKRWMSFVFAFLYAYIFKLKIISMIFETNGELPPFGPVIECFLISILIFLGSKWLHDQIKGSLSKYEL